MKKNLFILFLFTIFLSGCSLFPDPITIDRVLIEKQKIDATQNPARKKFIIRNLKRKKEIILKNILVKDIILSRNIDYDFCIISDMVVGEKKVKFFIYSDDDKTTAKLIKGKSRINIEGRFRNFFSVHDDYYTKIDIIKAKIKIQNTETTVPAAGKK